MIPFEIEALSQIQAKFKRKYPDFVSFTQPCPALDRDEGNFKRAAVTNCRAALGPYVNGDATVHSDDEAQRLVSRVFALTNLCNWRDQDWLIQKLSKKQGSWIDFVGRICACLASSESGSFDTKFEEVLEFLKAHDCPPNLTKAFPTYFLFLWAPKHHIFIKPRVFDRFLQKLDLQPLGTGIPLTVSEYQRIRRLMKDLMSALHEWHPRDFIDIQTLYWVVENAEEDSELNLWELCSQLIRVYPSNSARVNRDAEAVRIAQQIRESVFDLASELLENPNWRAAASVGQGNWARTPWVAVFDQRVTTSAQHGIFPAIHLYPGDAPRMRLGLGVSVVENRGRLKERAAEVRNELDDDGCNALIERGFTDAARSVASSAVATDGVFATMYAEGMILEKIIPAEQIDGMHQQLDEDLRLLLELYVKWITRDETVAPSPTPAFTIDEALTDLFFTRDALEGIVTLFRAKRNLILQGPPGVGKTFIAKRLAYLLMGEKADARIGMIQFHQAYSYEDFIQGYRPTEDGFELRDGLFHRFCSMAKADPSRNYVFIIDEINRGNISKILGELLMLIEADKRGPDWAIPLTYANDIVNRFYVPQNVYLLGMMNTADRSLALVDYALRRRFAFATLEPAFGTPQFKSHLRSKGATAELVDLIIDRMESLNRRIAEDSANLGPGFRVGHSYFCSDGLHQLNRAWYERVIGSEIAPLLREYWFDNSNESDSAIAALFR